MTTNTLSVQTARSLLPPPFSTSAEPLSLIAQGAESLLFRTTFLDNTPAALKVRPAKKWRHPSLDKRLTRQRILAEARVLVKCRKDGVPVPAVLGLDWEAGWMATEWVFGKMVKDVIREWDAKTKDTTNSEPGPGEGGVGQGAVKDAPKIDDADTDDHLKELLAKIGRVVALLHSAGVIHGDLTTSNMMLRPDDALHHEGDPDHQVVSATPALQGEIVMIDFGLATHSSSDEDRAVDLYVLERAFGSTHPRQERFFDAVLHAYGGAMGKPGRIVLKRLEDVRMRGRKKSMLG